MVNRYAAVRFHQLGGPEVLNLGEAELRNPVGNEVLVKVSAIGVTQGDAMYRSGTYLEQPRFPSGIGTEMCGRVEACGDQVSNFAIGDRVSSLSSASVNSYPAYGQYALFPSTSLTHTPEKLSDIEGAAYPLAYFSMYLALIWECQLRVGQWVLLNAAGATTSLAACQIAKLAGARVIGLTRSERKARELGDGGYDHVLVSDADAMRQVLALTNGGVDIVLDPVGGAGATAMSAMARGCGHVVHYGALAGEPNVVHSLYDLAPKFLTISGFTIYGYSGSEVLRLPRETKAMADAEAFIHFGVEQGRLKPKIAQTMGLKQVVSAHKMLAAGAHVGKIVLTV